MLTPSRAGLGQSRDCCRDHESGAPVVSRETAESAASSRVSAQRAVARRRIPAAAASPLQPARSAAARAALGFGMPSWREFRGGCGVEKPPRHPRRRHPSFSKLKKASRRALVRAADTRKDGQHYKGKQIGRKGYGRRCSPRCGKGTPRTAPVGDQKKAKREQERAAVRVSSRGVCE